MWKHSQRISGKVTQKTISNSQHRHRAEINGEKSITLIWHRCQPPPILIPCIIVTIEIITVIQMKTVIMWTAAARNVKWQMMRPTMGTINEWTFNKMHHQPPHNMQRCDLMRLAFEISTFRSANATQNIKRLSNIHRIVLANISFVSIRHILSLHMIWPQDFANRPDYFSRAICEIVWPMMIMMCINVSLLRNQICL